MELGQTVTVATEFGAYQEEKTGLRLLTGTVVYIHPALRYVVLEYEVLHGKFREAFSPWELSAPIKRKQGDRRRG